MECYHKTTDRYPVTSKRSLYDSPTRIGPEVNPKKYNGWISVLLSPDCKQPLQENPFVFSAELSVWFQRSCSNQQQCPSQNINPMIGYSQARAYRGALGQNDVHSLHLIPALAKCVDSPDIIHDRTPDCHQVC